MMTSEQKLNALNKFLAERPGKRLYAYWNDNAGGGCGGWNYDGNNWVADKLDVLTQPSDYVLPDGDVPPGRLSEADPVVEGDTLTWANVRNGLQYGYLVLQWLDDPWADKQIVAADGAHYGFIWRPSADDLGDHLELPEDRKTDVLQEAICRHAEKIGLESLGDPTDDGENFAVHDDSRFRRFVELAFLAQTAVDEGDGDPEEAAAELVAGFGTLV